jgi:hypothetical protein
MKNEVQTKLNLLQIQVRSELPANCIGYADWLTEENFPATGQKANTNLLRLEELRPGTLAQFASAVMGI